MHVANLYSHFKKKKKIAPSVQIKTNQQKVPSQRSENIFQVKDAQIAGNDTFQKNITLPPNTVTRKILE